MVNTISEYIVYSNKIVLHNSQITYLREGQLTLPLTSQNTTQRELTLTTIHRLRSGRSRCHRDARSVLSHHTSTAGPEYTTEGARVNPNSHWDIGRSHQRTHSLCPLAVVHAFTPNHTQDLITTDTPSANPLRERLLQWLAGRGGEYNQKGKEPAITGAVTRIWSEEDFWKVLQRGPATLKW